MRAHYKRNAAQRHHSCCPALKVLQMRGTRHQDLIPIDCCLRKLRLHDHVDPYPSQNRSHCTVRKILKMKDAQDEETTSMLKMTGTRDDAISLMLQDENDTRRRDDIDASR